MIITVKIKTDTTTGKRLENELRCFPEVVEFVDSTEVSDSIPDGYVSNKEGFDKIRNHLLINADTDLGKKLIHKLESHPQVVKLEYPFPTDNNGKEIETISATESAKLAFRKLGEKYNRTFDNKFTR